MFTILFMLGIQILPFIALVAIGEVYGRMNHS
jgi:hypothetical protein